jgi:anti-anti-sigma factor
MVSTDLTSGISLILEKESGHNPLVAEVKQYERSNTVMDDFSISVEDQGRAVIVELAGCFRNEDVRTLYAEVLQLQEYEAIIINLENLIYIDSGGIAGIIGLSRRVMSMYRAHLILCSVSDNLMNVFRTMKLDRVFPFHKTVQDALEAEGMVDKEKNPG